MSSTEMPATFWQGCEQFNQREFYACHDTLEALWMVANESDKPFYQGILQIAVGFYHMGNENWRGAVILLGEGMRRLHDYEPVYGGLNVTQLLDETVPIWEQLQAVGEAGLATVVRSLDAEASGDALSALHYPVLQPM